MYFKFTILFIKNYCKTLVPPKEMQTLEGELLRCCSKYYYRHYNDGDSYEYLLENDYNSIINIYRHIEIKRIYWNIYQGNFDEWIKIILNIVQIKQ